MHATIYVTLFAAVAQAAVSPRHIIPELIARDVNNAACCSDTKTDGPVITYTVVSQDTLTKLAQKFQSGICNIAKASNLPNPNNISVGQQLTIPTELCTQNVDNFTCLPKKVFNPDASADGTCLIKGSPTREVVANDTFISIAESLGLNDDAVQNVNPNVDPFHLQIGQTINIPICK